MTLGSAPPRPRTDHRRDPRRPSRRAPRRRRCAGPARSACSTPGATRAAPGRDGAGLATATTAPFGVPARPARRARPPTDLPGAVDTVIVADAEVNLVGPHRRAGRRVLAEVTTLAEARAALAAGAPTGWWPRAPRPAGGSVRRRPSSCSSAWSPPVDGPIWLLGRHRPRHGGRGHRRRRPRRGPRRPARARPRRRRCPATSGRPSRAWTAARPSWSAGIGCSPGPIWTFPRPDTPPAEVAARLGADDLRAQLLPVGQDGSFARPLADRYKTAGGIVQAVRAVDRRPCRRRPRAAAARARRRHRRHAGARPTRSRRAR